MVSRRRLLVGLSLGTLSAALPVLAQQERRVRRIGFFMAGSAQIGSVWLAAFREGMAELRWVEGRDYVIDARYANNIPQALGRLAAEMIATQPDLLLTPSEVGAGPLVRLTRTIPIVFGNASDPVGLGFAASLQRPGGNVTGVTSLSHDLAAKRLQLLKEAFPRVAHVIVLFAPNDPSGPPQVKAIEEAAPRMKMRITPIELRQPADIESAFKRGAALGAHAYLVTSGPLINSHRDAIVDLMLRSKVPAFTSITGMAEAGGLMEYAPSSQDNFRRAARYVDRILKGAKPGELPIEQPVKFELIVNLKTARAMGFTIPQSILLRADRVIE